MKCYVIKSKNNRYAGNRGRLVNKIIDAVLYEGVSEAKAHRDMLNSYHPEDEWNVIFVYMEEISIIG